jgi:hypothetical protein
MKLGENHNPSTFLGYLLEIFMKIKQFGIVLQKICSWVPTGNFHENQAIWNCSSKNL